jgi:type VI secretion system secreted protein Hcp
MLLASAEGRHIPKAILYGRKSDASGRQQEYLTITLTDVFISSYQTGGAASASDDRPTEEVAFYYNKITFVYISDDGTRTVGEAVRTPVTPQ